MPSPGAVLQAGPVALLLATGGRLNVWGLQPWKPHGSTRADFLTYFLALTVLTPWGRGVVKSLSDHPGNRPVPRIYAPASFAIFLFQSFAQWAGHVPPPIDRCAPTGRACAPTDCPMYPRRAGHVPPPTARCAPTGRACAPTDCPMCPQRAGHVPPPTARCAPSGQGMCPHGLTVRPPGLAPGAF